LCSDHPGSAIIDTVSDLVIHNSAADEGWQPRVTATGRMIGIVTAQGQRSTLERLTEPVCVRVRDEGGTATTI
jgi:hypothetical protein